jgi:hypothetical protein
MEALQLREDFFHRRIASPVIWSGKLEHFSEYLKILDFRNREERFTLLTTLQLVNTQEFRSLCPNPVALRLNESCFAVVQEPEPSLLMNRRHQKFVHFGDTADRFASASISPAWYAGPLFAPAGLFECSSGLLSSQGLRHEV